MIRVGRVVPKTRAEGPGLRFAMWVQGCRMGCPGCYARALWDESGGTETDEDALLEELRKVSGEVEGVTLLGGEPFLQAGALARFAGAAREMGLSVITFTGHRYEDLLRGGDRETLSLLEQTDLLIDGPYLQEQRDFSRPLVGSRNQQFRFLTERYSPADLERCRNRVEVRLGKDGVLRVNGMGDFGALEAILKGESKDGGFAI